MAIRVKFFIGKAMNMLGQRIRNERKRRGESQQFFAQNVGISQSFLSDIERNIQIPGGEVLLSISRYTGLTIDFIVKGENDSDQDYAIGMRPYSAQTVPGIASIPLFLCPAAAGSPHPGDDYVEDLIDLSTLLLPERRENNTVLFSCRVTGDSMIGAGIERGDYLICSKHKEVKPGSVVVCSLNGELTVKRYERSGEEVQLFPENPLYEPIRVTGEDHMVIHGVVTRVVKCFD